MKLQQRLPGCRRWPPVCFVVVDVVVVVDCKDPAGKSKLVLDYWACDHDAPPWASLFIGVWFHVQDFRFGLVHLPSSYEVSLRCYSLTVVPILWAKLFWHMSLLLPV